MPRKDCEGQSSRTERFVREVERAEFQGQTDWRRERDYLAELEEARRSVACGHRRASARTAFY